MQPQNLFSINSLQSSNLMLEIGVRFAWISSMKREPFQVQEEIGGGI